MNKISYPPGFRARRGLNWGAIGFMYASYYMCLYNFRFAGPGMNEEFGFDKTDLANIWVIWSLAYGTGQLVNGLFTDRIGGKWSMLIGAIGTIACNLIFGFSSFIGTLSTFALIALLNGWFQSFGAPGMVKINAAWFNRTERGTFAGIFGIMIQIGQFTINTLAPFLLAGFAIALWSTATWVVEPGTWRILFVIPPVITAAAALFLFFAVKEEPAAAGYPDCVHDEIDNSVGTKVTLKETFTTIFCHPLVWFYAAAYACTGAVRHSSDQLSVMFFTEQLGIDLKSKPLSVIITLNLMTAAAILGSIASGWISDRFFKGQRAPVAKFLYFLEAIVLAAAAAVTAASTANAPTSVHAQASVPSVALDHAVDPTASAATTAAAAEKFLCKPWLDAIFMAIYGDLVACAACSLPHHPHVQRVFLQILRLVGPRRPPQA